MSLLTNRQIETQINVHMNKMRAFQHKEHVKLTEINRENTKILNRLVEISKGKCVIIIPFVISIVCIWISCAQQKKVIDEQRFV